jgi:hypothetical protein
MPMPSKVLKAAWGVNGGYRGPVFRKALARVLRHIDVEVVKRSDRDQGFELLPKRWPKR